MNSYILKIKTINTYNQTSIQTITGQDKTPQLFLERCYQLVEEDQKDSGLTYIITEPENFGCSGGFASKKYDHNGDEFYENCINIKSVYLEFPW